MIERNEAQYGNAIPRGEAKDLYPEQRRIEDPWVHRSEGMRCRICIWFVSKVTDRPVKPDAPIVGRCRRHAPTMNGYPVVYQTDWCGDHRIDENKV
jgi:hypothetical protein